MGKKKIDNLLFIEDKNMRNITFCKRKRGLLKKTIEICSLCGLDMFMFVYDKEKQKMIEFRSDQSFKLQTVQNLLQQKGKEDVQYHSYTNKDYWSFVSAHEKVQLQREGKLPAILEDDAHGAMDFESSACLSEDEEPKPTAPQTKKYTQEDVVQVSPEPNKRTATTSPKGLLSKRAHKQLEKK